jgi:hypothetical protein
MDLPQRLDEYGNRGGVGLASSVEKVGGHCSLKL